MKENYKILSKFIKDMSSETPDVATYLFVKENISKYQLNIDITSKGLKDKIIEINTAFKFHDKEENKKKSFFEVIFATIIQVNDKIKEKKELEKIVLCDVQNEIYPDLKKIFLDVLNNSGYPNVKFDKVVNFEELYNQKLN